MQFDAKHYYSDFGKIELSRLPEQFRNARDNEDTRLALAAYVWNAWRTKDHSKLQSLGLKYF